MNGARPMRGGNSERRGKPVTAMKYHAVTVRTPRAHDLRVLGARIQRVHRRSAYSRVLEIWRENQLKYFPAPAHVR